MVTPEQAEEYMKVIGHAMPPEVGDKEWIQIIGVGLSYGFIKGLDWDTPSGRLMLSLIEEVHAPYLTWLSDNNITPEQVLAGEVAFGP